MICSTCKNIYEGMDFCPLCKTPHSETVEQSTEQKSEDGNELQYLVDYYSKKYYTLALEHSKKRQIYFAIRNLNKSLFFASDNKDTLNLLGLCYLETGRVGEASKQFLLSCLIDDKDNIAVEYLDKVEAMISETSKYEEAINNYNEALELVRNKNVSLATIELRNAVSNNNKFVDAYLLLILCCVMRNMYDEALKYINEVLKIDVENPTALKYLSEIKLKKREANTQPVNNQEHNYRTRKTVADIEEERKVSPNINNENKVVYEEVFEKSNNTIVYLIVAFALGCVLTFFFTQNYLNSEKNIATVKSANKLIEENEQLQGLVTKKDSSIISLEAENEILQNQLDEIQRKAEHTNDLDILINALELFNNGENVMAGNILLDINKENLLEEDMEVYDRIKNVTFLEAGKHYYDNGFTSLENGELEKSIESFEKSIMFNKLLENPDVAVVDAYYWAGKSYMELGNTEKALEYFNYILDNHKEYTKINEIKESVESFE